jgi:hypothetical protein
VFALFEEAGTGYTDGRATETTKLGAAGMSCRLLPVEPFPRLLRERIGEAQFDERVARQPVGVASRSIAWSSSTGKPTFAPRDGTLSEASS